MALHSAGHSLVILDDFSNASSRVVDAVRGLTDRSLPVVEGDAADPTVLNQVFADHDIDSVAHFAARKSVAESMGDPLGYYRSNLGSTIAVAAAAFERGVRRFVFSSSAVVYGTPSSLPVHEDMPTAPRSPYGNTKLMCETILTDAANAAGVVDGAGSGVVMLRYFNPVGAHPSGLMGENPSGIPENLVPRVMQAATGQLDRLQVFGSDYDTPDGTAIRDYIHVMDLAEGHVAALEAHVNGPVCSRVYNLGTGVGTSVLELLAAAGTAVGRSVPYELVGRRAGDIAASWADCTRARTELGWQARRNLSEMLRDHWSFWQHHHQSGFG